MIQNSQLRLAPLAQGQEPVWDAFVHSHPHGTIFHLTGWKQVVEKTFAHQSHYLAAWKDRDLCGIFPVTEIKSRLFGHFLVSVPFGETGGFLAQTPRVAQCLSDHAGKLLEETRAEYFEFRHPSPKPDLVTKDLYYTFSRPISSDHGENLLAIPRKSRAMVRKAMKNQLVSETGAHLLPEFYHLLSLNFRRLGTPAFPLALFENFLDIFGKAASILVVRNPEGRAIAGVLFFVYKNRMIPYYAGSDANFRQFGANDFMYWELMSLAADQGLDTFDFGRSKIGTGSFDFKCHWGFSPQPLAYQYLLSPGSELPNLSPANPKYRWKIAVWKRLPLWLTRKMGPYLSKYLA